MKYEIIYPTEEDINKMDRIAVRLFGEADTNMAEPNIENARKLISLEKNNSICFKDGDDPIAWSAVLPTSKKDMVDFLDRKLSERDLFEKSIASPSFEALYLFVVVVMPDYRKQGLGISLIKHQIKYFQDKYNIKDFYAWAFSPEGEKLILSLQKDLSMDISYIRKV